MYSIRLLFVFVSLALGGFIPGEGLAEEPARREDLRYSLAFTPVYQAQVDLESGGKMGAARYLFRAGAEKNLTPRTEVGLSLDYTFSDYDFSAVPSAGASWDQVHGTGVSASVSWRFARAWSLRVNPLVEFSWEEGGADWSDAAVYGLILSAARRFDSGLTFGIGLGAFSGLEEEKVFPLLLVIWDIMENLRLANPFRPGPGGPAGLELSWRDGLWELGLGAAYLSERFRLDDDGPIPGGIGEEERLPVWVRFSRRLGNHSLLDLWAGSAYSGELTLEDRDGHRLASADYDSAPFAALTLSSKF